jgi:hypothetical protein
VPDELYVRRQGVRFPRPLNHTCPQQPDYPITYFRTAAVIFLLLRDHIKLQEQIDERSGARVRTGQPSLGPRQIVSRSPRHMNT